jgi:hypothetical protein
LVLPLYAVTLFVSAFLLFLVQPMIGRMILPDLGGTPQVWNTCMMFFQTVLLAGYAYSHTVSTRLPLRRQIMLHGCLIVIPLLILFAFGPFSVEGFEPPAGSNPIFYTLYYLTLIVGLQFLVVSTSAPLLQRWFAYTGHAAGKDPYFLYGASNLGSMLALFAYPWFFERVLTLQNQALSWAAGYAILVALLAVCAKFVWNSPEAVKLALGPEEPPADMPVPPPPQQETSTAVQSGPPPGVARSTKGKKGIKLPSKQLEKPVGRGQAAPFPPRPDVMTPWRRLRWVLLAAAPSSLMLGAITYMSTDLSPMPMFWVLPLALYLLTFILVFARYPVVWTPHSKTLGDSPHNIMLFIQPIAVFGLCFILVGAVGISPLWKSTCLTLLAFFLTAMACHGELARDRPSPKHLTEFFLWMSVGGMIGGVFNGLFAPLIFTGVVEYPIALVVACLMRPELKQGGWTDDWLASTFTDLTSWFSDMGKRMSQVPKINFLLIVVLGGGILGGSLYLLKDMLEASNFVGCILYWFGLIVLIMFIALRFRAEQGLSYFLDGFYPLLVFCLCGFMLANAGNWGWLSPSPEKNVLARLLRAVGFNPEKRGFYSVVQTAYYWVVFGIPLVIGIFFASRPLRYGLAVAAVLLANGVANPRTTRDEGAVLYAGRTYFGVLRVYFEKEDPQDYGGIMTKEEAIKLGATPKDFDTMATARSRGGDTLYYAPFTYLMHGTTHHGLNYQLPKGLRRLATTYYHARGPTGIIMEKLKGWDDFKDYKGKAEPQNAYHSDATMPASLVGMGTLEQLIGIWSVQPYATVGLGTGTMASYGRPFQHVTFYEIDDVVRSFHVPPYAPNGPFYNYVGDAIGRGVGLEIIMGDARQSMKRDHQGIVYLKGKDKDIRTSTMNPKREKYYRVIELDAFSSDAIPVHLITLESVQMYFSMLSERGVLCVHTSNRHADLTIPARDIATQLGYAFVVGKDQGRDASGYRGHFGQEYVMIARKKEYLPEPGPVKSDLTERVYMDWSDELPRDSKEVWTDNFTNLVDILRAEDTPLGVMPPVRFLLIIVFTFVIVGVGLIILITKSYQK